MSTNMLDMTGGICIAPRPSVSVCPMPAPFLEAGKPYELIVLWKHGIGQE